MKPNYRLYSLTNYYLSSLQKGLQTAHVVGAMAVHDHDRNFLTRKVTKVWREWAGADKTIIMLNGGNSLGIVSAYQYFSQFNERFPVAGFGEDEESLNGAWTAAGIILPESVYTGTTQDSNEQALYEFISKLPLAV